MKVREAKPLISNEAREPIKLICIHLINIGDCHLKLPPCIEESQVMRRLPRVLDTGRAESNSIFVEVQRARHTFGITSRKKLKNYPVDFVLNDTCQRLILWIYDTILPMDEAGNVRMRIHQTTFRPRATYILKNQESLDETLSTRIDRYLATADADQHWAICYGAYSNRRK